MKYSLISVRGAEMGRSRTVEFEGLVGLIGECPGRLGLRRIRETQNLHRL